MRYKKNNEITLQKKYFRNDLYSIVGDKSIINNLPMKIIIAFIIPKYGVMYFYRKSKIQKLKSNGKMSYFYYLINYYLNHIDISPDANIGNKVKFPHPLGVVIGGNSTIGDESIIFSCVTLGANSTNNRLYEYPRIGKHCYIGTGAKLIGGVNIGDNSTIGANAVVNKSYNPFSVIAGVPSKLIATKQL